MAIGFARKSDGSTALAAVVGYLVFDWVTKIMFSHSDELKDRSDHDGDGGTAETARSSTGASNPTQVLGGILIGVIAALLYQRYYRIKLPTWLASSAAAGSCRSSPPSPALVLGVLIGLIWPVLGGWLTDFGEWITGAGAAGAGVYGVINRLLLPFGLHHIPNSLIWFVFGTTGGDVTGDINRYLAGDPTRAASWPGSSPS